MRRFIVAVVFLSTLVFATCAWAQSNGEKAQEARKPNPASILPLANKSLLLGVVNTGKRLVAVGAHGHILISESGEEWQQVHSPSRATLTAVDFAGPGSGWAVGWDTVILHTSDGGKTWELQYFAPELQKPLLDVVALSKQEAMVVGAYGLIMVTRDGGEHWKRISKRFGSRWHLNSITQLRNGALLIAGEKGTLGYSSDGGRTWMTLQSPYDGPLFDAAPMGSSGALIAGLGGHVYCTLGKNWHKVEVHTGASFMSARRLSDGRILLTGQDGTIRLLPGNACPPGDQVVTPDKNAYAYLAGGTLGPDGGLIVVGQAGIRNFNIHAK